MKFEHLKQLHEGDSFVLLSIGADGQRASAGLEYSFMDENEKKHKLKFVDGECLLNRDTQADEIKAVEDYIAKWNPIDPKTKAVKYLKRIPFKVFNQLEVEAVKKVKVKFSDDKFYELTVPEIEAAMLKAESNNSEELQAKVTELEGKLKDAETALAKANELLAGFQNAGAPGKEPKKVATGKEPKK
jgi:hypothetical protein